MTYSCLTCGAPTPEGSAANRGNLKYCTACGRAAKKRQDRAYYDKTRDDRIANATKWNRDNLERRREISRNSFRKLRSTEAGKQKSAEADKRFKAKHHDRIRQQQSERRKARRLNDPAWAEKERERARQRLLKSPEKVRQEKRESYRRNWHRPEVQERFKAGTRNRRAMLRNVEGKHTRADVQKLFEAQAGLCANPKCKTDLHAGFEVDHIVPVFIGGTNWPDNLQLLCRTCNRSKGHKHPSVWNQ